jgi:O-antigen biosynthesis protein WbqP
VNGRDSLPIPDKVNFDQEYMRQRSFLFDLKVIYLTLVKVLRRDDVQH